MAPDRATARHQPPLNDSVLIDSYKRAAAEAAAKMIEDGMRVGLGTGSTVAFLLPALAERKLHGLRCVATSPVTEHLARTLGLNVEDLDTVGELDIAIDGADQVDPSGWLVKGGGAALTREKIVAAASRRFVVIVSDDKPVAALHPPVPLELLRFGVERTLAEMGEARLRGNLVSPDGNPIADYFGPIGDPASLASRLSATPGVVEHGLFAPQMVSYIWIAGAGGVAGREGGKTESGRSSSSGATE